VIVVVTALAFDFTNGFHDTATAVATSISTRAVSPGVAVAGAALLNFVGAFESLKVADTVGTAGQAPAAAAGGYARLLKARRRPAESLPPSSRKLASRRFQIDEARQRR
jgi:PiT family inorganic phosphate transporter